MRKVSAKKLIVPILAAVLLLFSLPVNAAELSQTEQAVSARVTAGASGFVNGIVLPVDGGYSAYSGV